MDKAILRFLEKQCDFTKPVLLALSGGPDSLALFHLLLNYKQQKPLKLGIAHIDHAWRSESEYEAQILEKKAKDLGIPFHLKKLNPKSINGNLEAACREARFAFFKELCQHYHYQAVLLGHHQGDQVETVLKRFFEGASLVNLSGLREVTRLDGLVLWRPLLQFNKREILNWIVELGEKPFQDPTNKDSRFLRGKMRNTILPFLNETFGKQIENSLEKLSQDSRELADYLDLKLAPSLKTIRRNQRGLWLGWETVQNLHLFELKHLIRRCCESVHLSLSKESLANTCDLILAKTADKQIIKGEWVLQIDRGHLFIEIEPPKIPRDPFFLQTGCSTYGSWSIEVKPSSTKENLFFPHWKEVWSGSFRVWLPEGNYYFRPPDSQTKYPRNSTISRWWTNAKVPAFFRDCTPLIWEDGNVKAELLSGKRPSNGWGKEKGLEILFNQQFSPNSSN